MNRSAIFAAAVAAGLTMLPALAVAARLDAAVVRNSGSTNAPGYTITVWTGGRATVQTISKAGAPAGGVRTSAVPRSLAAQFLNEAAAARRENAAAEPGCMKSASFGSTTTVSWHGWTSGDLACPQTGAHARVLAAVVGQIARVTAAGQPAGRLIHLPINEPRRAPIENSPAPRPSPNAR